MKAIIFAGGVGTRLWPLSRKKKPKQLMNLVGGKTMLQLCVDRLVPGFDLEDIYIATNKEYVPAVKQQLPGLNTKNIISEPVSRDVGPAVGLATAIFSKILPKEPIIILWGDHLIGKEGLFRRIIKSAGELIENNPYQLILVGQKPRFASVNLGWIEFGKKMIENRKIPFFQLKGFKYQPNKKTAEKYYHDNIHAWNLGYWVTSAKFLWHLYKKYAPQLFIKLKTIQRAYKTKKYQSVLNKVYPTIDKTSFDNAIVEKMDFKYGLVVSVDLGWSDVGAWEALKEALQKDKEDNITSGKIFLKDCFDNLIYNYELEKLVVGVDLNDFVVINTKDVLLVTKKTSVPKVKKIVEAFKGTELESFT